MDILLPNEQVLKIKRTTRKNSVGLKVVLNQNTLLVPKTMTDAKVKKWINQHYQWIEESIRQHQAILQSRQPKISLPPSDHIQLWGEWIDFETLKKQAGLAGFEFELENWLNLEISAYLEEQVAIWAEKIGVQQKIKAIKIRFYKTRWGSCDALGRLQFNWRLVAVPKEVVQYVVIHELCHLIYLNHSVLFWEKVAQYCPEYQQHRHWLKQYGKTILTFETIARDGCSAKNG